MKNAGAFYRMAEFYMDWDDPDALRAWKRAMDVMLEWLSEISRN